MGFDKSFRSIPRLLNLSNIQQAFEIAQKYGISIPDPNDLLLVNDGANRPDLLLTVGSGCENLGK